MKKILSFILAAVMTVSPAAAVSADDMSDSSENAIDYTTGTPWPDIDLEGVVTEDTPANLKDNFVLAVNKEKLLKLEIPEGYSNAGTFTDLSLQQAEDTKSLFKGERPESHDGALAYDLFGLLTDWDSRNEAGITPLKEMVDKMEAVSSLDALTAYFVETPPEEQIGSLWTFNPSVDQANSSRYLIAISDRGLLLKDSAEYTSPTPLGKIRKEAFSELAGKMLVKLGYSESEAEEKISNCFACETMLAASLLTSRECNEPDYYTKIYNVYSREDLEKAQGSLPILRTLEETQGYPAADEYIVEQPAFIEKLNEIYTEENVPLIRDMLIVNAAIDHAAELDRECYEWYQESLNKIEGSTGALDDETAFFKFVSNALPWPVARLYCDRFASAADKERISKLIDEVLDTYHGILEGADFLSDETRAKAVEKLEAITKHVLYPDSWDKYSCEELNFASPEEGGTLWEAMKAIQKYDLAEEIRKYEAPVDKDIWPDPPQTVNCCYMPESNSVFIFAAFAKGAFYNENMSDEELYATLGSVIGHEISHAFDSTGAQYDKDGNMARWWTEEDYAKFLERNAKMVDYYNAIHPWEGQDLHGSIMTGEACADMAGVKAMLQIAAQKPDFDYDKFFRTYASIWLMKCTLQDTYRRIEDVHPLGYLRINCTLQQYDEFLDFYDIKEGDGMYLAPEDRVAIW